MGCFLYINFLSPRIKTNDPNSSNRCDRKEVGSFRQLRSKFKSQRLSGIMVPIGLTWLWSYPLRKTVCKTHERLMEMIIWVEIRQIIIKFNMFRHMIGRYQSVRGTQSQIKCDGTVIVCIIRAAKHGSLCT